MRIGRTFHFDAAHFLHGHPDCGKIHGHTWSLTIEVEGPVNPETGMVADFKRLKRLVEATILSRVDHKLINHQFEGHDILLTLPTCENLCAWIGWELEKSLPEPIEKVIVTLREGLGGWARHECIITR